MNIEGRVANASRNQREFRTREKHTGNCVGNITQICIYAISVSNYLDGLKEIPRGFTISVLAISRSDHPSPAVAGLSQFVLCPIRLVCHVSFAWYWGLGVIIWGWMLDRQTKWPFFFCIPCFFICLFTFKIPWTAGLGIMIDDCSSYILPTTTPSPSHLTLHSPLRSSPKYWNTPCLGPLLLIDYY